MPDPRGILTLLEKRTRHRRALLRMLFDRWQSDVLLVCIDPANTDLIRNFYHDTAKVRLLEFEFDFSDANLTGHAKRIG